MYHYPKSIFDIIEKKIGDNNFYNSRIAAERGSAKKTLEEIYKLIPRYSYELELEIEKEYTFPIRENFSKIEDGDIVVSDMYLSEKQIHDILLHHGLNKDIKVYSSYGGKASGAIWNDIKNKHNIESHTGDNLYSDVILPRSHGIETIYYHGSNLNYHELMMERYSPYISYWSKVIRLLNPHFSVNNTNKSISHYYSSFWIEENNGSYNLYTLIAEDNKDITLYCRKNDNTITIEKNSVGYDSKKILWSEQANFNLPILLSTIYLLPKHKDIIFSYRDCVYLKMLYDSIYDTNIDILHSSRQSFLYPFNKEYIDYVVSLVKNKYIIDLHGTGNSSQIFAKNNNIDMSMLFVTQHCDSSTNRNNVNSLNICFHKNIKETIENTKFNHNRKASKMGLKCCRGTVLEKLNISPGIGPLVGWVDNAPYRSKVEHNTDICQIFMDCIKTSCSLSKYYRENLYSNTELLDILLDNINDNNLYANSVIHTLWDKKS
jgi:hypothetical protein